MSFTIPHPALHCLRTQTCLRRSHVPWSWWSMWSPWNRGDRGAATSPGLDVARPNRGQEDLGTPGHSTVSITNHPRTLCVWGPVFRPELLCTSGHRPARRGRGHTVQPGRDLCAVRVVTSLRSAAQNHRAAACNVAKATSRYVGSLERLVLQSRGLLLRLRDQKIAPPRQSWMESCHGQCVTLIRAVACAVRASSVQTCAPHSAHCRRVGRGATNKGARLPHKFLCAVYRAVSFSSGAGVQRFGSPSCLHCENPRVFAQQPPQSSESLRSFHVPFLVASRLRFPNFWNERLFWVQRW